MIILTAIANYTIEDIKPFVLSLKRSGYNDKKIAVVYNLKPDVISFLKENSWELYEGELREHVILQRFVDLYYILKTILSSDELNLIRNEYVLWLDIKDVIFQKNPSDWFNSDLHANKKLLAFSECVRLNDDDWARVNCGTSFPMEWEFVKNEISYCAGTIAGQVNAIADLFIEIYRWARTTSNPQQLSDQAAYNVLLYLNHFKNTVDFVPQEDGFLTNLGTVLIKKDYFSNNLLEKTPLYENNKFINPETNDEFYIVHQYDRNPYIKEKIINAYLD
jgi:hypothetical protein